MTRNQRTIIGLWVGFPFAVLLLFFLINPAYETRIFSRLGPISGMTLLIGIQAFHFIVLYSGFRWINQRGISRESMGKSASTRVPTLLLAIITLVLLMLPSLWLVVLYPSVIFLLNPSTMP